jgi:elongation factor G
MAKYTTADIRNITLVGHGGCGKTTLAEALLHKAGAITTPGQVEKNNTVCDFEQEEKEHQHSLSAAIVSIDHQGKHVNLIDTPGFPDFIGHTLSVLPAVETVAVVISASSGIEMMTRRMMERAKDTGRCRMIVINKIDAENIELEAMVEQIRETFGSECLPINLPTSSASGVIDVFNKAAGDADFSSVEDAHTAIVDQVVEVDEDLMEKYLEQGEVRPEELVAPLTAALTGGHLVPICFTSARTGAGVSELLNVMIEMMPSPAQGNAATFTRGEGEDAESVQLEPDAGQPAIAHVFKVSTDPFVGKLAAFRIHRGTITKDTLLRINGANKPVRIGHLLSLQGKEHSDTDEGMPGDICGVAKVDDVVLGAVMHESADDALAYAGTAFPTPMFGLAIEAKSRGDEAKISKALTGVDAEDPCFLIERNAATNETVVRGMGDMHLRIILEKMKNRYNVEVGTKPPKIAYRETVLAKAEGHHRHKKQTGGAGQFGEVYLRIEPLERGAGFEFSNDIFGGSIPSQFIPAIEKGVRQAMADGVIAGYAVQDMKVSVYDGKHHPVDSKEVAFVAAGKRAFMDAVQKARPVLLEPIVDAEITIPSANVGDITGDLSGKRGRIQGTDMLAGDMSVITAQVPLAEMMTYQSQLKSVTGGQGSFAMEFSHYETVPSNVQQAIVAQYKPKAEED